VLVKSQITGAQIKAARGLLGLKQSELAELAGLSRRALVAIENGQVRPRKANLARVRQALEERGAEFRDGGVGRVPNQPA
jgi:transcriptional regulator with XRE-family HTH domain